MIESDLATEEAASAALFRASRALLGIAAESLVEALDRVTLPQLRVLIELSAAGPQPIGALANRVGAVLSTFSRLLDRLEKAGFVRRAARPGSRREVLVHLTDEGTAIAQSVNQRRQARLAEVVRALDPSELGPVVRALEALSDAAGEPPTEALFILGLSSREAVPSLRPGETPLP